MAYSTNNTTAINVTNFGAIPDGVTDNSIKIQGAISSLYALGGGTVFFPKGKYLTSGYLNITGNNITLQGERGSTIATAPSGNFRKINISGVSGVVLDGLIIDGGRTSGQNSVYAGTINIYSSPDFTVKNCNIINTEGLALHIRGSTSGGLIQDNTFENFQTAIYGDGNDISGQSYHQIRILGNEMKNSWGGLGRDYFGGIKLQSCASQVGFPNIMSRGHVISNNTFYNTSEMGIELWGEIADSVVSNNTIEYVTFGISIANKCANVTVIGNSIKSANYLGIELADSYNINVIGNTVDGSSGSDIQGSIPTCNCSEGIMMNGINCRPNFYNVIGNTVKNASHSCLTTYSADQVNIIGNMTVQTGLNCGSNFYNQGASHITVSNNSFVSYSGSYFVMLDDDSVNDANGITISNNDFNGSVTQWGILYYNDYNSGTNTNVLIENNRTYGVQYCGYGMVNAYDYPPRFALHRNNFGPATGGYFIPDQQIPPGSAPYGNNNILNGITYYGGYSYTIPPTTGITGNGVWLCLWSGGGGADYPVRIRYQGWADYLNHATTTEFYASMVPYQAPGIQHTLTAMPQGNFFGSQILQAKTLSHDSSNATNSFWVQLAPTSTGMITPLIINYSEKNNLPAPYVTYTEPVDTTGNAKLYFNGPNSENLMLKVSNGVSFGNAVSFYPISSGVFGFQGTMNNLTISTLQVNGGFYDCQSTTITGNLSIDGTQTRIYCNNSSPITVTFPSAATYSGYLAKIKVINTSSVTLTGVFGQTFDTGSSYYLSGYNYAVEVHSNGANWYLW